MAQPVEVINHRGFYAVKGHPSDLFRVLRTVLEDLDKGEQRELVMSIQGGRENDTGNECYHGNHERFRVSGDHPRRRLEQALPQRH